MNLNLGGGEGGLIKFSDRRAHHGSDRRERKFLKSGPLEWLKMHLPN